MKKLFFSFIIIIFITNSIYSKDLFKNISVKNGLPDDYITCFAQYNDSIWIGTSNGLVEYKNDNIAKIYSSKDGLKSNFIVALINFNTDLYIITMALAQEKCCHIYKKTKTGFDIINIPENVIVTAATHWKNKIWLATWNNGLFSFDPAAENWENYTIESGIVENSLISIYASEKYLFIGSSRSGFSQYDGDKFTTFDEHISQLINNTVSAIYGHNDTYYLGTYLGVNIYSPDPNGENKWISYTTWKNRLIDNYVKDIYIKDSIVWIGTNGGLTKFDPQNDTWMNFTIDNGLLGNKIFTINAFNNSLWIGTDKGISIMEF